MRERDSQRSKVYSAEEVLKAFEEPLPSVQDIERFVACVWKSQRVKSAFSRATPRASEPRVKDGRGRRKACGSSSAISMPVWSRNNWIVLHELAHVICQREHGMRVAAHGWEYCAIYLRLVLYVLGREAHDKLKASFKQHRVRFRARAKRRELSEVQREALRERLKHAREARARQKRFGDLAELHIDMSQ